MQPAQAVCLYCNRNSDQVPLIALQYRDGQIWICPQHLPILIHKPDQLSGQLPGSEDFGATSEENHHHG